MKLRDADLQVYEKKLFYRSNRPEVFCKKGVLRSFAKFTGKQLCQSFFFNKVADLRPATLLKQRLYQRCFPVNFAIFLRTPFLQNTSGELLLLLHISFMCSAFRTSRLLLPKRLSKSASKIYFRIQAKCNVTCNLPVLLQFI